VSEPTLLLVRLRPGVVGESRRVVHVVSFPTGDNVPEVLVAYCGEEIRRGPADVLPKPCGAPCEACLIEAPLPAQPSGGRYLNPAPRPVCQAKSLVQRDDRAAQQFGECDIGGIVCGDVFSQLPHTLGKH